MPKVQRSAEVVWEGNVARGGGTITGGSGALSELPVTLPTRLGDPEGHTSPEELIAAAHAACFAMALSNELSQAGKAPEQLHVTSTTTLEEVDGSHRITAMDVDVRGKVAGLDDAEFTRFVGQADAGCPVSNLLRASGEVRVQSRLG